MPTQVIITHPNWFKLMKSAKTIKLKVDKFECSMDFTKHVLELLDKNPVFQQKLWDAATKEWKAMLKELDQQIAGTEVLLDDTAEYLSPANFEKEKKRILGAAKSELDSILERRRAKMANAVDKEWAKIRKQNAIANNFKIKTVFKAIGKTIGITSSVAALVVSGGLNFIAYVTLARAIASSISEMKKLCKDLDKFGKEIESDVQKLAVTVKKHPKLLKVKEVSNILTFAVLGTTVVNSHTSVMKKLPTYKGRVAMLQQKHMGLGKDIKKMMDKIGKEKKKADKASQQKMHDLEKELNKLLIKTAAIGQRFAENDAMAIKVEKELASLSTAKGRDIINVSTKAANLAANATKLVLSAVVLDAASASDAVASIAEQLASSS